MRSRYDRLVLRRIALRAGFVLSPEYHVGRGSLSSEPWNKCGRLSKTKERIRFIPFFEAFLCPFLLGWHIANSGIIIRDTVFENVDKMLHCGDYDYGHALYGCEFCGNIKVVPFRCKSRFCTTCGNLYSFRRSTSMSFKLIRTTHRHCVFTIPEELRPFFAKTVNS